MALFSQIVQPFGSVLQVEDVRYTLMHLNARILITLTPDIEFLDYISMDQEEEKFVWEVSLLGNLGSCLHCKKNGHTKKYFPTLSNM